MATPDVIVVGGGLAGCEAASQLGRHGLRVHLYEMKPTRRTPAQHTDRLAELVCSNSLRGAALTNAVGLLKEELRRAGSLILQAADASAVPAGGALAVDRDRFSGFIEDALERDANITLVRREVTEIPPEGPVVVATGPLTSEPLAQALGTIVGAKSLAYYDAIAPIVSAETIDRTKVFSQSRYDKGEGDSYLNCPFEKDEYFAFVTALRTAEKVPAREFEETKYFEGCLPCEVMAERGERTLAFGPMKPVGLTDPRTGRRPYAVLQLRPENAEASAYNMVGFQTRMTYGEQVRVFRTIPGLEQAEFMRLGSVHRNTFLHAPVVMQNDWSLVADPRVHIAGQITGVEGYVESAASGFMCALALAAKLGRRSATPPPTTTALGSLWAHTRRQDAPYQPSNITWAHFAPLVGEKASLRKHARYEAMAERALGDLGDWLGLAS